jgi:hypothetical protein
MVTVWTAGNGAGMFGDLGEASTGGRDSESDLAAEASRNLSRRSSGCRGAGAAYRLMPDSAGIDS